MQVRTARIRPARVATGTRHGITVVLNMAELSWIGETVAFVTYNDEGAVTNVRWVWEGTARQKAALKKFAEAYGVANLEVNGALA